MKTLCALALFAAAAFAQAPTRQNLLDKANLEAYLRRLELWIPQVAVQIDDPKPSPYLKGFSEVVVHLSYNGNGKEEHYLVSADGTGMVKGEVFDLTKSPFQATLDKIKTENQPSFGGSATAPVTLVVYGDFQCPYCKAEADVMRKNVTQTFGDKVRVVFKDFPLEQIHPWARAGSIAGRCVYKQDAKKFWDFHDWIYAGQAEVDAANLSEKVNKWAADNGLNAAEFGTCVSTKATDAEVQSNLAEGRSLGINATPTSYLNGFKLEGTVQWEVLQQVINMELTRQGIPAVGGK
ncbi:MAG: DsbA family protein [Bryobacteraceae bacterium]